MFKNTASRNVFFVLLGVAVLLLKRHYSGLGAEMVQAYAGNASISFAVYFILRITDRPRLSRLMVAGFALLAVELFEATDGFGIMGNTYDPADFIANAVGVGLALAVDALIDRINTGDRRI